MHAAGVLEDQRVMDTTADSFACVLSAIVSGALALDAPCPLGALDWLVLFSPYSQNFDSPGKSATQRATLS